MRSDCAVVFAVGGGYPEFWDNCNFRQFILGGGRMDIVATHLLSNKRGPFILLTYLRVTYSVPFSTRMLSRYLFASSCATARHCPHSYLTGPTAVMDWSILGVSLA